MLKIGYLRIVVHQLKLHVQYSAEEMFQTATAKSTMEQHVTLLLDFIRVNLIKR